MSQFKFIIKDKSTGDIVARHKKYPNRDKIKLVGFDYNKYNIYEIIVSTKPSYNPEIETITYSETFTEELSTEYPNVKKCNKTYTITPLSDDGVISKLNTSLGNHLDTLYPVAIRVKHLKEGLELQLNIGLESFTPEQQTRYDYLTGLGDWMNRCRVERDSRELEFTNNKITPSLTWENKPN